MWVSATWRKLVLFGAMGIWAWLAAQHLSTTSGLHWDPRQSTTWIQPWGYSSWMYSDIQVHLTWSHQAAGWPHTLYCIHLVSGAVWSGGILSLRFLQPARRPVFLPCSCVWISSPSW